jgi:CPA1 family monovalent cation:H+ antiporter
MGQAEILITGLLVAVTGLSVLARHLSVSYPIVLVCGAPLGFVPRPPEVKFDPEFVVVVRSIRVCC